MVRLTIRDEGVLLGLAWVVASEFRKKAAAELERWGGPEEGLTLSPAELNSSCRVGSRVFV